jgi:hypothetical protein
MQIQITFGCLSISDLAGVGATDFLDKLMQIHINATPANNQRAENNV